MPSQLAKVHLGPYPTTPQGDDYDPDQLVLAGFKYVSQTAEVATAIQEAQSGTSLYAPAHDRTVALIYLV